MSLTRAAADYFANELRDQKEGGFFAGKRLDGDDSGDRTKSLQAQMAGIRGPALAALDLTNDERYRAGALRRILIVPSGTAISKWKTAKAGLYYTPLIPRDGLALRELIIAAGDADARNDDAHEGVRQADCEIRGLAVESGVNRQRGIT